MLRWKAKRKGQSRASLRQGVLKWYKIGTATGIQMVIFLLSAGLSNGLSKM